MDGISAQDPLAGTGFGVEVSSGSIGDLQLITGGAKKRDLTMIIIIHEGEESDH